MSEPIPVIWLSLHEGIDARGPWDTRILEAMFDGSLWPHHLKFEHLTGVGIYPTVPEWTKHTPAIVIIPAAHHCSAEDIIDINWTLTAWTSVLLILCGDELGVFPWKEIKHPNIKFWVQAPDPKHYADMADWGFFFGWGWGGATPELITEGWPEMDSKDILWSFSGQITNSRRKQAANGLQRARARVAGVLRPTQGFSQGLPADEYARELAHSWVVPCPSGPHSVDSFRVYEALEAGCIPLVDAQTPAGPTDYWNFVYGRNPLLKVDDWEGVGGIIETSLDNRCRLSAECSAWWKMIKSTMVHRLISDLEALQITPEHRPDVQAIVTSSPIPSNPSLDIIWTTVLSIEKQLGAIDILVACDGVRPEQEHMAKAYDRFLYYLCSWARRKPNVLPLISDHWGHQANLTKRALQYVTSPCFLFVEHDTPLNDRDIDWQGVIDVVSNGHVDVMRFHHESHILDVHEYLMVDHATKSILGVPLRRTRQWSQRPHLANTEYYRKTLRDYFPLTSRTMIEDTLHSVAQRTPGHRLAIYHPEGSIQRSNHLDGRGSESKFPMVAK